MRDAVEEVLNIELQIVPVSGAAHERLCTVNGSQYSATSPVRICVVNKHPFNKRGQVIHKPVLRQPVPKGRSINLTEFRVSDGEPCVG